MANQLYTSIINKTDYIILEVLAVRNLITPFFSATIEQLMEYTSLSKTKIRNTLRVFMMMGLVKEGNKDKRNKTYYITEQGEDHYMEIFDMTPEQMDILREQFEAINTVNQETAQTECLVSSDIHDTSVSEESITDKE